MDLRIRIRIHTKMSWIRNTDHIYVMFFEINKSFLKTNAQGKQTRKFNTVMVPFRLIALSILARFFFSDYNSLDKRKLRSLKNVTDQESP